MGIFLWGMIGGALLMIIIQAFEQTKRESEETQSDLIKDGIIRQLTAQNDMLNRLNGQLNSHLKNCKCGHSNSSEIKWVDGDKS